jgi:hypothetical protein
MNCLGGITTLLLHIANFVYFVAGGVVLAYGIVGLVSPSTLVDIMSYIPQVDQLSNVVNISNVSLGTSIYMITLGGLAIVLCFVGSCGAFKGRSCIVIFYVVLTLLMMLFNIILIIFMAVDPYFIQDAVEQNMRISLEENFQPVKIDIVTGIVTLPNDTSADAWITMQFEQACCGVVGPSDYENFEWDSDSTNNAIPANAIVPPSCCLQYIQHQIPATKDAFVDLTSCYFQATTSHKATNYQGCLGYMMQQITRYNFVYQCTAAGMTGIQAIIIALSMYVISRQRTNKKGKGQHA